MKGAVSILVWFVSVCFHRLAARGGRHRTVWCPSWRPASGAGRLGAPLPLEGARHPPRGLRILRGMQGADGQGARGASKRLCGWRGAREGRGGASPWTFRRGSRGRARPAGAARWRSAPWPILRGGPPRVAASDRSVAGRGGDGPCQGSLVTPPPTGPPLRFSAVLLVWGLGASRGWRPGCCA